MHQAGLLELTEDRLALPAPWLPTEPGEPTAFDAYRSRFAGRLLDRRSAPKTTNLSDGITFTVHP